MDGGPVRVYDLTAGDTIPADILHALTDPNVKKYAHNAGFERICFSRLLRDAGQITGYLSPEGWYCTMVWSAYAGLPLSLEDVGAALGLEEQKLTEGKDLIRYFCQPCKPTKSNKGRIKNLAVHAPEKWDTFVSYNKRDVEVEMQIAASLRNVTPPPFVWQEYWDSEAINDRGIAIDRQLVNQAIRLDALSQEQNAQQLREITGLDNPRSVTQMKQWLCEAGLAVDTLGKKDVQEMMKGVQEPLRSILALRLELARSSVKKYTAMKNAVCADGRLRGMFMFYGATRSGRFAGRIVQLQNLYRNDLPDLDNARSLVKAGNLEGLELLYDSVPEILAQLTRTAFIPSPGNILVDADFAAIEARVIAWLAGEQWRMDLFSSGGDIYCQSASQMFGVPVEKHGINGHLRQKGKIAELACIAEGQLVLTDQGLIPIEKVTTVMKLWDGEEWISHDGVIYRGEREVITYEGLTATPDHLVFIEGQSQPIQFGIAATCRAHLIQTGDGGRTVRLGENHQSGETMEQSDEPLLYPDAVPRLRLDSMAESEQPEKWEIQGVPELHTEETDPPLAGAETDCGEATVRKSKGSGIPQLWGERDKVRFSECYGSRVLFDSGVWYSGKGDGDRSDRHQQELCSRESSFCGSQNKLCESAQECSQPIRAGVLALCEERSNQETVSGNDKRRDNWISGDSRVRETEKLANNRRTARLYDIRNAGRHHRFTVSGKLVHNCGYGGGVGALKAMGALDMGLSENELQPLVSAWRTANPNIVRLWWDVDKAVKEVIQNEKPQRLGPLKFTRAHGRLQITLPSGRVLNYVRPRIGSNRFGGESVTYMGIDSTHHWAEIESYGPKFVENIVQGIARDVLCFALHNIRQYGVVAHIHDEALCDVPPSVTVEEVAEKMAIVPPWAEGLILRADGYSCAYFQKDA